jgi:hypothetical protein
MESLRSSLCQRLPAALFASFRYSLVKVADEKIPLSVVQVNNKPQYLVFWSHSQHLVVKHGHLPVESSKCPCFARTWVSIFAQFPSSIRDASSVPQGSICPVRHHPKASPGQSRTQGAGMVQISHLAVRTVDIQGSFRVRPSGGHGRCFSRRRIFLLPCRTATI